MKRVLVPVSIVMAALYLALAAGAAGCLFTQPERPGAAHHHHHTSHVGHSAFCAWACQANPAVGVLVEAPQASVFHLVALLIFVLTSMPARSTLRAAHPRAPPSF